jgi:hypothetical protein
MKNRDTHPFPSPNYTHHDVLEALLAHIPDLWAAPATPPDAPSTVVRDAWEVLCGLGIGGLLVPTEQGGQGANLSEVLSVAWTLSRIPAPVPFLSSAVMAPLFAAALGERALLSEIATGDTIVAVAAGAQVHGDEKSGITLHGEVPHVLHGRDADLWLIVGHTTENKTSLTITNPPLTSPEPNAEPTRPTFRARFDGTAARRLADCVEPLVGDIVRRAHVVRCAEVLAAAHVIAGDDHALRAAIGAAVTAVRTAAAATDLDNICDPRPAELARARTATVADLVRTRRNPSTTLRAKLCTQRATGGSCWLPSLG